MKRILRNSLSSNNSKEQLINSNSLKKQKLITAEVSTPPPHYVSLENGALSDVLTEDTPRSDDTHTLHSDTSDSDTVTEEDNEYYYNEVPDKEVAVRNGKEQGKAMQINNNIISEKTKLFESYINKVNERKEIVSVSVNKPVRSEDKR